MHYIGGAVRSASRGLSRLVGRKQEEETPRSNSIIRERKAGFGYNEVSVEEIVGQGKFENAIQKKKQELNQKIQPRHSNICQSQESEDPYLTIYKEDPSKHKNSADDEKNNASDLYNGQKTKNSQEERRLHGSTKEITILETAKLSKKNLPKSRDQVTEENHDEFEVMNNLTNIKDTVKTAEAALSVLEQSGKKRATNTPKDPGMNLYQIKIAFFYLVGSNCMPNELRIPWYLQIMSAPMKVNKGSEMLMKVRGSNPNSTTGNQEQILKPLRVREIKETWNRYLLYDIPNNVLLKIESAVRSNDIYRKGPTPPMIISTLIKFYSLWAMVLYKPLQKSVSAICQSLSISTKSELFVDYPGNKVPIDASALDGVFEGVWMETTKILHADKFVEFGMQAITLHPATICMGFIDKMIPKEADSQRKQYQQLVPMIRDDIYKVIDTLQKNFLFWEESQLTQAVNIGFMLDLFVLLNGKLVMYLVAKILTTNLDKLQEWADSNQTGAKLLEECKKLVMQPTFDQVTELLDFDFIRQNIYQMGAKS